VSSETRVRGAVQTFYRITDEGREFLRDSTSEMIGALEDLTLSRVSLA
jgi:DNA-binding PadR family transcriptional regulator